MGLELLSRLIQYRDTKANCIAATGTLEETRYAYATDTAELGIYTGGAWVWIGGIGHAIEDEGVGITQRATMNFTGPGVAVTDSGGKTKVQVSRWEPLTAETIAWEDIRVAGVMTRVGATAPSLSAFGPSGSLKVLFFEEGHHDEVHFEIQMPHSWKQGTKIYPHVHWTPVTTEAGNVVWELEYAWANIAGTFGAPSNMATDATAAGGTAWVHHMTRLKSGGNDYIDGTGKTASSMLVCRLHRNAGAGSDTLTEAVAFLEFDLHYQVDGLGSDLEDSKSADTRYELVYTSDGDVIMCEIVT